MAIAQSKEVNAVSAAVEALRKAMIAADRSALEKLTADELSYGHSSGRLENRVECIDALSSLTSTCAGVEKVQ